MAKVLDHPVFVIEGAREDCDKMLAAIREILAGSATVMVEPVFRIRVLRSATVKPIAKKGPGK